MYKRIMAFAVVALCPLFGCESGPTGGKTGPQRQGEETFTLEKLDRISLKPGEAEKVTISIDRGDDFNQAVKLEFGTAEGIEVTPKDPTIPSDKSEVEVNVQAKQDAPVGEKSIQVTAKPEGEGKPATVTLTVNVEKPE
ncbi:MAG TPA: hypothetical protein VIL46_01925 [Gemmataceae bacterium]